MMTVTRGARCGLCAGLLIGLTALTPTRAAAQSPAPTLPAAAPPSPKFFSNIQFGGLADAYYDYNSNKPDGDAPYRNFDTKHNKARFSMAQLWASKTPTAESRIGFNVRFNGGHAAE